MREVLLRSIGVFVAFLMVSGAQAGSLNISTDALGDYLLVGQIDSSFAKAVQIGSELEIGRVSQLPGSAPTVNGPGVGPTVSATPTYDGNVAITNAAGTVQFSDINVYADIGIDCMPPFNNCTDGGNNFSNTNYDDAAGGLGLRPIAENDGVNGSVDLTAVTDEILAAKIAFGALGTADVSISTSDGVIDADQVVFLGSGLNIVNFTGVGSNDISVNNDANLIFQGAADAFAVVLLPDDSNFLTSEANLVIGDGGIGLNNVVIVSLTNDNDTHFNLSNTIINGVALWDLGMGNGVINFNNVGGCTQVVGDELNFNDIYLNRCAFEIPVQAVPVPAAVWLFGSALGLLGWMRRKAN